MSITTNKENNDHGRSALALHPTRGSPHPAREPRNRQQAHPNPGTGLSSHRATVLRHPAADRTVPGDQEHPAEDTRERVFSFRGYWLDWREDTSTWYIAWYDRATKRRRRKTTSTGDLGKAKQRLIGFAELQSKPKNERPDTLPIAEVFARYLEESMTRDRVSRVTAENSIRIMLRFFDREGITWVSDLDWETQGRFMAWREKIYGVGDETISRDMSVLKAALNWCRMRNMLTQVPHIRMRPKAPPRSRFLTESEVARLLAACEEPHLALFIRIALGTLARPGAILGLRVEQVDLESGIINFLPKGQQQNNKRRPIVPIGDALRPHLEEAIANSLSGHVVEYLGRPVKSIKKSFRTTRRRAGLGDDVIPYVLRHTGATWAAADGVDMRQLAGMMGHSQQRTTELYAKHHPTYMRNVTRSLDDRLRDIDI